MDFVITKNNFTDLNCFFSRNNLNNISRPIISYLKVDSATNIQPIFHIGFKENMGFIDSYKINGGIMIFEVLEGYPLQDLLFTHNSNSSNKYYKFRLEELDPMDFYCVQSSNKDIFGDFILKNLKFISTKMDQSVENYGRKIIAEFICSEMLPFRIPYFYNNFISDDYDYHIIRDKKEIKAIQKDIYSIENEISDRLFHNCMKELDSNYTNKNIFNISKAFELSNALEKTFNHVVYEYIHKKNFDEKSSVIKIQKFIKIFYEFKNKIGEEKALKDKRLMLTNYKKLGGL